MKNQIYNQDSLYFLKDLETSSVDCCITDPPYGLSICRNSDKKDWDDSLPKLELYKQIFRVVKEGSLNLFFSSPRQDLLFENLNLLNNSGFNISFSSIYWVYTKSVIKGLDISKFLKKNNYNESIINSYKDCFSGFQPKICTEIIIVCQKPFNNKKSNIQNILETNKGLSNFNNTKIPSPSNNDLLRYPTNIITTDNSLDNGRLYKSGSIKEHHKRKVDIGANKGGVYGRYKNNNKPKLSYGDQGSSNRYFDIDYWWVKNKENLPDYIINTLPYLIESKSYKKDKGENNNHPSVKPLNLMSYLIQMFTSKDDIVLDPFMGSGTTILASIINNRNYIGVEKELDYYNISESRIKKLKDGINI